MKPRYEMADIFRLYGDEYRKTHAMNPDTHEKKPGIFDIQPFVPLCSGYQSTIFLYISTG